MPHVQLPVQLTSFIGRGREIAEIKHWLARTRLLTLTGAGGCGKTRLALQVVTDLARPDATADNAFPDGIWWVELAPLSNPALVADAVGQTLGVREKPNEPLLETLATYLESKQLLLVLDNCEHLLRSCAELAATLQLRCRDLTIMATSREPLGIVGEIPWVVPSLSLPKTNTLPHNSLSQFDAVRLFVERATTTLPAFAFTDENAAAVAQVCQRLDGIPLALELAAARINVLTVEQIASRLDDSFALLTSGNRMTVIPRHQTLRAAIDWSYNFLSEPERVLFHRLSVFAGGWTLAAAEAVCTDDERRSSDRKAERGVHLQTNDEGTEVDIRPPTMILRRNQVLDLLSQLVEKSFVLAETQARQEARYRLLETMRQYSREKFQQGRSIDHEVETIRAQHAAYYLALAQAAEPALTGARQLTWLMRLEAEHDNLRAALQWSLDTRNTEMALGLCGNLWRFWDLHGHVTEGSRWLAAALALPTVQSALIQLRAQAVRGAGVMALRRFDVANATALFQESLRLSREIGDTRGIAGSLNGLGVTKGDNLEAARPLFEESLTLFRELGHAWGIARALQNLAIPTFWHGDPLVALRLFEESLAVQQTVGDSRLKGMTLCFYGQAILFQNNATKAADLLHQALSLQQQVGDKVFMIYSLIGLAGVASAQKQAARSARLLGAAEALGEAIGSSLMRGYRHLYERIVSQARDQLSPTTFAAEWAAGRALTVEEVVELAQQHDPAVVSAALTASASELVEPLSEREIEVLKLIAAGASNQEIADALVVALNTVKRHVSNIMTKLGVANRTQAVARARALGLL